MRGYFHAPSKVMRLLLAALLVISTAACWAERVEDLAKPTDYVSDYAHVLSAETVARLDRLCTQLDHSQANAQVAVVTVRNLDGDDAADYANQMETKWKMGKKGSDRGVLLLLAVDDHKYRIDVGFGLEGILNDAKVGDFGRTMRPYLQANDYDSAVMLAVGEVGQTIAADAKVSLDDQPVQGRQMQRPVRHNVALGKLILLIILLIFFGGGHLFRFLLGFEIFSSIFGGGFRGGGGFGGGGFGGGDGGDSGGSGFGGFGGGDFGGGGAGGDW